MDNVLANRVSRLERLTSKLGQANELTNSVVSELVSEISDEIRYQIKEEIITHTAEIKSNVVATVSEVIDDKVRTAVNDRGLNRQEMNKLTSARNIRFGQLLGDSKSDKYILLISFFQGAMIKGYRKLFECGAYGDIEATRFNEAIAYINNFDVELGYYNWAIETLHRQYRDGEIENKRKYNAYERFFGIRI